MLDGYKHLASSIEETPEKQFASLDIKEKLLALENSMIEEHMFKKEVTIKGTHYGPLNDIKIEGNTLINLVHGSTWTNNMKHNNLTLTPEDGKYCHINCYSLQNGHTFFTGISTLTVSFEVTSLPTSNNQLVAAFTMVREDGSYDAKHSITITGLGKYYKEIELKGVHPIRLTPRFYVNCRDITGNSGAFTISNLMIFEGSVEPNSCNYELSAISNVGDNGVVKLRSCGKNIINHFNKNISSSIERVSDTEFKTSKDWQTFDIINMPNNKKYILTAELKSKHKHPINLNNIIRMDYHRRGGVVHSSELPNMESVNGQKTISSDYAQYRSGILYTDSTRYQDDCKVLIRNSFKKELFFKNMMLEEVDDSEYIYKYEPYKGSEINIRIGEPLRGVGNIKDSIEFFEGEYVIIRRCEELDLKCVSAWTKNAVTSTLTRFSTSKISNLNANLRLMSNFTPNKSSGDNPGIFSNYDSNGNPIVNIDVPNSIFNNVSPTEEQFKTWIKSGVYKIVYPLSEFTVEKINNQEEINKLLLFDGVTHIYGDDNPVYPLCTVKIPTNLCAELDSVESAISILEKEVTKMENVSLTSVMALIDRKEEIKNGVQTQD